MRIVFFSQVEFGKRVIEEVIENNWNVGCVFIREIPDSSGFVSFDDLAVPVYKVDDINDRTSIEKLKELNPDVIFVIGWNQMVSDEVISIPNLACLGHHPSLLPKHKGRAPIPWSLIHGLTKSGVTFFHLVGEVDAGDIFAQKEYDISINDDAYSVYNKGIDATIDLILNSVLPQLKKGKIIKAPQDHKRASHWHGRKPEDGIIDWDMGTTQLYNWIRGLTHPYPGAFTYVPQLEDEKLIIWGAKLIDKKIEGEAGKIIKITEKGMIVGTGNGCLLITNVQLEGDKETNSYEFTKKYNLHQGVFLG